VTRISALFNTLVDEVTNPVKRPTFWALVTGVLSIAWPGHVVSSLVQDFVVAAAGLVAAVDVGGRYHVHAKANAAVALESATAAARAAADELRAALGASGAGGGQ
jgi:hypothetical protein